MTISSAHKGAVSKPVSERQLLLKDSGTKRHRSASPAVEGSPQSSPKKKKAQSKGDTAALKKTEVPKKLDSKKKPETQVHKIPEVRKKETQKITEAQKQPSSPKWFHLPGKQQRSRSESPKVGARKVKDEDGTKGEAASSASATGSGAGGGEESQMNVLDRIKQYNVKDAAVQGQGVGGGGGGGGGRMESVPGDVAKPGKGGMGKREEKGKGGGNDMEKDRGKRKGVTKEKTGAKERKKGSKEVGGKGVLKEPSKHWNPFRKTQKNPDKAKKDQAKKAKKPQADKPADAQIFSGGVKNRIEMLKELGLETDGTDHSDAAVLLSVVHESEKTEEEEDLGEEEEGATGDEAEESGEEEDAWESDSAGEGEGESIEELNFSGSGSEVRMSSPEAGLRSPSPDNLPELSVVDKVKILQEVQDSVAKTRPRCSTDAKR
jgi:hypothetical protein